MRPQGRTCRWVTLHSRLASRPAATCRAVPPPVRAEYFQLYPSVFSFSAKHARLPPCRAGPASRASARPKIFFHMGRPGRNEDGFCRRLEHANASEPAVAHPAQQILRHQDPSFRSVPIARAAQSRPILSSRRTSPSRAAAISRAPGAGASSFVRLSPSTIAR